jgi:hypothetical protein
MLMNGDDTGAACASENGDMGADGTSTGAILESATALLYAHDSGDDARDDVELRVNVDADMDTGVRGTRDPGTGDATTWVICVVAGAAPLADRSELRRPPDCLENVEVGDDGSDGSKRTWVGLMLG